MTNEEKVAKLTKIKAVIDAAKSKKDRLEGTKENLFLQLKQYGCDSKEKGQTELDRLDGELKRLETEFDEGLSNLEKSYEWN